MPPDIAISKTALLREFTVVEIEQVELLSRTGYDVEYFPKLLYNSVDVINGDGIRYAERATDSMVQI